MANELWGKGESTASQSAWALMGLLAVSDRRYRQSIERGVGYLIKTQQQGTWDEPQYTGTGFPGYAVGERIDLANKRLSLKLQQGIELGKGFMINYNLYRHYFPLMALGRARRFLNHG
jgi:squalene-hopene/tetraprenyl-beta-curcumene cyclase